MKIDIEQEIKNYEQAYRDLTGNFARVERRGNTYYINVRGQYSSHLKGVAALMQATENLKQRKIDNKAKQDAAVAAREALLTSPAGQLVGQRALSIDVYRNSAWEHSNTDCTLNGVSRRSNELFCLCADGPHILTADDLAYTVELVKHSVSHVNSCHLVPVISHRNDNAWHMMGGNYAGTSDSRFNDMVHKLVGTRPGVVAVHDRIEK